MSSELVTLLLAIGGAYWFACIWWPFVPCRAPLCEGGKQKSPLKRATRPCPWCKGKGTRVRFGRRLYQRLNPRATKK